MKKIIIRILMLSIFIIIAVLSMRKPATEEVVAEDVKPIVEINYPTKGDIYLKAELIGQVESDENMKIYPKISGEIVEIFFEDGQWVEQGQILCTINSDHLAVEAMNLQSALIKMRDEKKNYDRLQALFAEGSISSQQLEQQRNNYQVSELTYSSLKENYDLQVSYTSIIAPVSGIIESSNITLHENVTPAFQVCIISNQGKMSVSIGISENIKQSVHINDPVEIIKDKNHYQGTITKISNIVDESTGLYEINVVIDEENLLTIGSKVKTVLVVDKSENTLLIPTNSIYFENGDPYVFLYQNGVVKKQSVEIGLYDNIQTEILTGVDEKESVISSWSIELYDGAEVEKLDQ